MSLNVQAQSKWAQSNSGQPNSGRPKWIGYAAAVVVTLVCTYGLALVFSPWVFSIGGRFTPFMTWHGYGRFAAGQDSYFVFVDLAYIGASPGSGPDSTSDLEGTAFVCGPNGSAQQWRARLETAPIWLNTDGAKTNLHLTRPTGRYGDGIVERFDIADLPGVWSGSSFTLMDKGELAAFAGSHTTTPPHAANVLYASRGEFDRACQANRR